MYDQICIIDNIKGYVPPPPQQNFSPRDTYFRWQLPVSLQTIQIPIQCIKLMQLTSRCHSRIRISCSIHPFHLLLTVNKYMYSYPPAGIVFFYNLPQNCKDIQYYIGSNHSLQTSVSLSNKSIEST